MKKPAAQMLVAETAEMAVSPFVANGPPGLGLATVFQDLPFQCRISVLQYTLFALMTSPTAHASFFEMTVIAVSVSLAVPAPGLGDFTGAQCLPFQYSMSVRCTVPTVRKPTAQALHDETTPTPLSPLLAPAFGGCGPGLQETVATVWLVAVWLAAASPAGLTATVAIATVPAASVATAQRDERTDDLL